MSHPTMCKPKVCFHVQTDLHTGRCAMNRSSVSNKHSVPCQKISDAAVYALVMSGGQAGCQIAYGLQASMQ